MRRTVFVGNGIVERTSCRMRATITTCSALALRAGAAVPRWPPPRFLVGPRALVRVCPHVGGRREWPRRACAPSHWDIAFIRKFMLTFGPISSLFDFLTFGLMLGALHAGPVEFRTGWFVESLATQTPIIFAIRTRRVPFFRSRPSGAMTLTTLTVVAVGVLLTISPVANALGFTTLPWQFFGALVLLLTVAYLVLVEVTKKVFYAEPVTLDARRHRTRGREHRIQRRAARFSHDGNIARQ